MNTPAPVTINPQLALGAKILVDLSVDALIRANAGGDPAKEYANAQATVAFATAFEEIAQGDATDVNNGIQTLDDAIDTAIANVSPGQALALQNAVGFVNTKLAAFAEGLDGTLEQTGAAAISAAVLAEVEKVAAKYPQPASATQKTETEAPK